MVGPVFKLNVLDGALLARAAVLELQLGGDDRGIVRIVFCLAQLCNCQGRCCECLSPAFGPVWSTLAFALLHKVGHHDNMLDALLPDERPVVRSGTGEEYEGNVKGM